MPKIIFTSRYLRDAPPAQLENYVRYISTREGVEKIDESKLNLPATKNQKELIQQLIRDIPASKEMLEYADFLLRPTIGNASEFISCALEQNLDLTAKRENYVDYIANRPRVERMGEHGLFTDAGKPVVLSRVQQEVTAHKGAVWTHVVSLRREDAARLGYDSAEQWMALLRSKRAMLCRHMKISSENLRWYAAFHNEGHHPHVHLMVYSAKDHDGYLTEKSIEAMRSELAHDIFRQDFAHIYEQQNQARNELKTGAADAMRELMDTLRSGTMVSPEIEKQMTELSRRLQNTGGRKVYGYLKRDVKNLIDQIVDELEKDSRVSALYQAWGKWNNEILLTYQKEAPPLPPLSGQPQFKSIKNMVIAEALKLGSHHFTFEDERMPDSVRVPDEMPIPEVPAEENVPEWQEQEVVSTEQSPWNSQNSRGGAESKWWNRNYKQARQYLYGSEETEPDFAEAFRLLLQEAESGNALAMYDLGRMFADGLGREIDMAASQEWYRKALAAFHAEEQTAKEKQRPYLQYRIGKMYRAGIGTAKNREAAEQHFRKAFTGFCGLEKESHDDKLQYRLGQMLHTGTGIERDDAATAKYWKHSAKLGNVNAQYALGKMYRDGEHLEKDLKRAEVLFIQAAEQNHEYAAYALGRLYLSGDGIPKDVDQAVRWLQAAVEQNNSDAAYTLGKLYLAGEDVPKDVETAIRWLARSAEQENQFAQYALGKLYLCGHDVPRDKEKAIPLLMASAAQAYFTDEQKERANAVDLADFLHRQGEKLLPSGRDKRLASDHSITIRGNRWYDHACEKGGCFIDFVRMFYDKSFPDAVTMLLGGEQGQAYRPGKVQEQEPPKPFVLPETHSNMRRVYGYLTRTRCIDQSVVSFFARAKMIYEDAKYHNAVFVGFDKDGVARHAHKRSTYTQGDGFKGNVEGCDPRYSFHHIGKSDTIYVFEAPIDMMSFICIYQKDWKDHSYAALCGVSDQVILQLLSDYPHIRNIGLCLDNDDAGIQARERITKNLSERGYQTVFPLFLKEKDWNEDLKEMFKSRMTQADQGAVLPTMQMT